MIILRVLALALVAVMPAPAAYAISCGGVAGECYAACGGDSRCFDACMRRYGCHKPADYSCKPGPRAER
jgi:hypothetical protein